MKKALLIVAAVLVLAVVAFQIVNARALAQANAMSIATPDPAAVSDGSYEGACALGPVSVRVRVAVNDHKITDIAILAHVNGLGSAAEHIASDVVGAQSLEVDTVAGATVSSKCILRAVQNALETIQ